VLGSGTLNAFFGDRGREPVVSLAVSAGLRDEALPVRGRDEVLGELAAAGPGVDVVCGLGGCGKTRVALEAAIRAQADGAEVWWVPAADQGVLEAGMRALGRRLGLGDRDVEHGDAADRVWRALSRLDSRWLLVVDNADEPHVLAGAGASVAEGRGWLRPVTAGAGRVLVT
jgi:hypothetical protein